MNLREGNMRVEKIKVSEISVGDRVRKDLGDIESLSESIDRLGLLNPITVKKDDTEFELLAGHRRLAAVEELGWDSIFAQVLEEGESAWRP